MKTTLAASILVALSTIPVGAADTMRSLDLNSDRFVSLREVQAVYPDFNAIAFRQIDVNGDNRLSSIEAQSDAAQIAFGRHKGFAVKASAAVDTDGGNAVHFLRSGGRLLLPTTMKIPQDVAPPR